MNVNSQTGRQVELILNEFEKKVFVNHSETLLHTLREKLGLMGAKPGCKNGDCGSCTILLDGTPINACHILTVEAIDYHITTIEGLKDSTVQNAFIQEWAIQCGYCTPGLILNCYALAETDPNATEDQINEWLDSNICRCTGYMEIKEAIKHVLQARRSYGKHA